jgi:hypothetical protein
MDAGLDKRRGRTGSTIRGADVEVGTFMGAFEGRRGIRSSDRRSDPLQQKHALKLSAIPQNWLAGRVGRKPAQGGLSRQLVRALVWAIIETEQGQ